MAKKGEKLKWNLPERGSLTIVKLSVSGAKDPRGRAIVEKAGAQKEIGIPSPQSQRTKALNKKAGRKRAMGHKK